MSNNSNNNINNNNNNHTNNTSNTSTSKVNGTQACAACKYQRRKCAPDCILAPYFPHDRHRQFLNAHKLFGVSNITKIIRNLDPPDKDQAMRTIIFQSDVRASDPVGGCYRIIRDLQRQIDYTQTELVIVLQQLAICRAQAAAAASAHLQPQTPLPPDVDDSLTVNCDSIINPEDPLSHVRDDFHETREEEEYLVLHDDHDDDDNNNNNNNNHVVPLHDIAAWAMHDSMSSSLHDKQAFVDDCKPTFLDIGGERLELKFDHEEEAIGQSEEGINSKEEKEGILKDEIGSFIWKDDKTLLKEDEDDIIASVQRESQDDHHLNYAATFFTLTNCTS
ncbi:hypothetical protein TEA_023441 [Camellia sinensis var. sinensis]|uniref:LOB domain-containing protein n=1 Tax=Camellia sinensis var. sinensis TaxID=542762 RepID=A0A4S4CWP3_CAMSN|nr:hypothetical protein TEA_023441 [Camellia sinensis var. sinensis]